MDLIILTLLTVAIGAATVWIILGNKLPENKMWIWAVGIMAAINFVSSFLVENIIVGLLAIMIVLLLAMSDSIGRKREMQRRTLYVLLILGVISAGLIIWDLSIPSSSEKIFVKQVPLSPDIRINGTFSENNQITFYDALPGKGHYTVYRSCTVKKTEGMASLFFKVKNQWCDEDYYIEVHLPAGSEGVIAA